MNFESKNPNLALKNEIFFNKNTYQLCYKHSNGIVYSLESSPISINNNMFVFQVGVPLDGHIHYALLTKENVEYLVHNTDSNYAVASEFQPFVLISTEINGQENNEHFHELTVYFDYINHTFIVTNISNNEFYNHQANLVGAAKIPTLQEVSDAGGLRNGSTIRQGSVDRFGLNGIEIVCSEDKMIQFADGREYYYSGNGPIIYANSMNGDTPDSSYDETQGFRVGSFFNSLALGKTYICTDATTDNAVWIPMGGAYVPTLDYVSGAITDVALDRALYNISNGICDVTIYGSVDLDFSAVTEGTFSFTLPVPEISGIYGTISMETPNQCNGIVRGNAKILSNDTTFVTSSARFVAKFSYQAF